MDKTVGQRFLKEFNAAYKTSSEHELKQQKATICRLRTEPFIYRV